MRIALYDPSAGGHRPGYITRFVEALAPVADLLVAVPDETLLAVGQLPCDVLPLGARRPELGARFSRRRRRLLEAEVEQFHEVSGMADIGIHLFADKALPLLASAPQARVPTCLLVLYPTAHYPRLYETKLTRSELLAARLQEWALGKWRRRSDAALVWTLDEGAAQSWAGRSGASAHWLPEPPVDGYDLTDKPTPEARRGCVLYGAMTDYKGIDRLARALKSDPSAFELILAGYVEPAYRSTFDAHVADMRHAGVRLDVRDHSHTEQEGLNALGAARCVALPYQGHKGMSRVLLEAAVVRTPVVVHDYGLLGHLVRRHGIGLAVDTADPVALRRAILELCLGDSETYASALGRFAERYSRSAFDDALSASLRSVIGRAGAQTVMAAREAGSS